MPHENVDLSALDMWTVKRRLHKIGHKDTEWCPRWRAWAGHPCVVVLLHPCLLLDAYAPECGCFLSGVLSDKVDALAKCMRL